jgi:HKD family nuclease
VILLQLFYYFLFVNSSNIARSALVSSPVNVNLLDALGLGGTFVDVPDDTLVNSSNIARSASVSLPVC